MKKLILILGSACVGYALNTETGKKVRNWVYTKAQEQINNLVTKINEVTSDSPTSTVEEEESK